MPCQQCGGDESMPYTCAYCGLSFCVQHRLPEKHDCSELSSATTLGPEFRQLSSSSRPSKGSGKLDYDSHPTDNSSWWYTLAMLPLYLLFALVVYWRVTGAILVLTVLVGAGISLTSGTGVGWFDVLVREIQAGG